MDEKQIIESLSPIEQKTIKALSNKEQTTEEIAKKSGQDNTTILRALTFLEKKGLVTTTTETTTTIQPGILGLHYKKNELPERTLLNCIKEKRSIPIGEIGNTCKLNENETKIAIGELKKKQQISIQQGRITYEPKEQAAEKTPEEQLLEKLPLQEKELTEKEQQVYKQLQKRKELVEKEETQNKKATLTTLGKNIQQNNYKPELIEQLTTKMIKNSTWKGKKFRRYDLTTTPPRMIGGKKHFINQATTYAKNIWKDMGFKEMKGPMIETAYWNFDALFTAQDHPVREMQDTFYIKNKKGTLPKKEQVEQTKKAHEKGVGGSRGWNYEWNEEEAKKLVLRTHTTNLSVRQLKKIAETKEYPAKYFSIGKCFRNETVDWSHGFEFNQTEGIVIDEKANFRQLLGYLTTFFKKMGYEKLRIRPGYFPYTEPSVEMDVYHEEQQQWIELGAAGMFRPEVTIPLLGKHIPVLAWGPGFDRTITQFYKIKDLRQLYKNDLKHLRELKHWRTKK